jgi:membrane protease YdiL (CAAX protease family)
MTEVAPAPPGFWRTLGLLLRTSMRRASGRLARTQAVMRWGGGRADSGLGSLAVVVVVLISIGINLLFGWSLDHWVAVAQHPYGQVGDRYVAPGWFVDRVREATKSAHETPADSDSAFRALDRACQLVASASAPRMEIERVGRNLCRQARIRGPKWFINLDEKPDGLPGLANYGALGQVVGSVALILWMASLALISVGAEVDSQRRRNPMWEWLFSHPAPPGAVFLAEALAPIFLNPAYIGAPFFCLALFSWVYGGGAGFLAMFVVGVPITIAIAGLGKAIETSVMLRFAPRSRGAILGILGWLGTIAPFLGFMLLGQTVDQAPRVVRWFRPLEALPWPWIDLFLGERSDGSFSLPLAIVVCWSFTVLVVAGAVGLMVFAARQGVGGATDAVLAPTSSRRPEFGGADPLYRKEFLWFRRDRSALLQVLLIPISMTALQLFNMRGIAVHAVDSWNYLAGAAILLGVFFLFALSPKALASEGAALWISLTWPRGLEELMRVKARLWAWLASLPVAVGLLVDMWFFPFAWGQVALVAVGWALFVRSFALKAVTLISAPTSSGEPEKIPTGRRWAVSLGSMTFALGVISSNWPVAITGIFYAFMSAAAMWENFKARLPYLFDPWSETPLTPPTLTHAMVAISALVEILAVWTVGGALLTGHMGPGDLAVLQAVGYGVVAVVVALGVANFLRGRNVSLSQILHWPSADPDRARMLQRPLAIAGGLAAGAGLGLALAALATGYVWLLRLFPQTPAWFQAADSIRSSHPQAWLAYAVMAVALAPTAEEFLFRGLLYRALDREWGGWRAVVGSACFFASYHPFLAWAPVALAGGVSAILFKRVGWLGPSIALHAVYNMALIGFG